MTPFGHGGAVRIPWRRGSVCRRARVVFLVESLPVSGVEVQTQRAASPRGTGRGRCWLRRRTPRLYSAVSEKLAPRFVNSMSTVSAPVRDITVAHSPDSDDAFMFYGLATNKVRVPGLRFTHTLCDIETLNQKAQEGVFDVTAVSFHAYPYIQDDYALMSCGGSVGDGYGPMIVSPRPFTQTEIKKIKVAVPGKLTTAYLALKLFAPGIEVDVVPFDQIIPQVLEGKYEAGLIIHEGQLTYDKSGLHRVVDLG